LRATLERFFLNSASFGFDGGFSPSNHRPTDLEQPNPMKNEKDGEVVPLMDYELARAFTNVLTSRAEVERMQIQRSSANLPG